MDEIKGIRIVSLTGEKEYGIEDSEVREELANVVDGAPEELDSFKEAFEKFKEGGEALDKIKDGDTIVGQAREIHLRNGKTVTDSFLARTTAGSGTIGDGVASLKSVDGNIVKNLVDKVDSKRWAISGASISVSNGIMRITSGSAAYQQIYWNDVKGYLDGQFRINGHKYYYSCIVKSHNADSNIIFGIVNITGGGIREDVRAENTSSWQLLSMITRFTPNNNYLGYSLVDVRETLADIYATNFLCIDLTEMFGAGNEPTKEECDRLFGTMDALPQGLSIAKPAEFKSTGFNQFNPENVLEGKAIVDNALVSGDKRIAVIPCLPCKVGTGENNGYCIHGDFGDDIKVYLTPLNPMKVDGELYMHKLTKDATTDTYVPLIKGYMLVEVPTTANLCAHFLWSEDKCERDTYEPYFESKIEFPVIPQMSGWGLAGIQSSGTLAADTIDFERGVYVKRIGSVDLGSFSGWIVTENYATIYFNKMKPGAPRSNILCNELTVVVINNIKDTTNSITTLNNNPSVRVNLGLPTTATREDYKKALSGKILYYELATPEEYPLPKVDNNYISSDYGVEQFDSVVPCNANNLYYMRSLAGETRNFLDRMYANTGKEESPIAVADYITNGIEGNKELATNAPNLALRALFVAAGADYNDSGADKTKTAPWGETVTHKAGYYYLNGLGDITEEQMMDIYNAGRLKVEGKGFYAKNTKIRTTLPLYISGQEGYDVLVIKSIFADATGIEVAMFSTSISVVDRYGISIANKDIFYSFYNCRKLRYIQDLALGGTNARNTSAFNNCNALEYVKIRNLAINISFSDSSMIKKESVEFIIKYANPSSAITITLHPDAYARLADDAEIVAALVAQPLITLVSA